MSAVTSQNHSRRSVHWKDDDYSCATLRRSNKMNREDIKETVHELLDAADSPDAAMTVLDHLVVFAVTGTPTTNRGKLIEAIEPNFTRVNGNEDLPDVNIGELLDNVADLVSGGRSNYGDTLEYLGGQVRFFEHRKTLLQGGEGADLPHQADDAAALPIGADGASYNGELSSHASSGTPIHVAGVVDNVVAELRIDSMSSTSTSADSAAGTGNTEDAIGH